MTTSTLRNYIRGVLAEADIADVAEMCYSPGSTHTMTTCKLRGDKYFLKFASDDSWRSEGISPSLQNLAEYLAYRVYSLYSGVKIPKAELVYDEENKRVGIATTPVSGKQALVVGTPEQELGKMMSKGVYVDIFLANWDVVGTGSGNVFVSDEGEAVRLDPGAALQWRAQGGRKGKLFSTSAGELKTMLDPGFPGAGRVFRHADLKEAASTFLAVPWSKVASTINAVGDEVSGELSKRPQLAKLLGEWQADVDEVLQKLEGRHAEVAAHAKLALNE